MKILIIGKNSFLASEFIKKLEIGRYEVLSHREALARNNFEGIGCIINFAYHPFFVENCYKEEFDIDYLIRNKILKNHIHYVMISSRRVYGQNQGWNSSENDKPAPNEWYGINKHITEKKLLEIKPNAITILRVSNVIGKELNPDRLRMGSYLINCLLRKGKIEISYSLKTKKDVISINYFSEVLNWIICAQPDGIFNIGSGNSQPIGTIAQWIINGFGKGEILCHSNIVEDNFQLDNSKFVQLSGLKETSIELEKFITNLGKEIRELN
jgi:UDP-glucose 4-epimerase